MATRAPVFKFRRNVNIGSESAELDGLLDECFVENAAYEAVRDPNNPKAILLGRSGAGKSAIIRQLRQDLQDVQVIEPQSLAFQFLGGSELLQALRLTGVQLDLFYKLVWRHVFVVELIKRVFPEQVRGEIGTLGQILRFLGRGRRPDAEREAAANYLDEWGTMFFQTGEHRIIELHESLEKNLAAKLGLGAPPLSWLRQFGVEADVEAGRKSTNERTETIRVAQQVASEIQISHLALVVRELKSALSKNEMRHIYFLVDDLDTVWADTALVYDLVRALLMEIYDLRRDLPQVKVVVALRDNILHKAEAMDHSRGYQREKLAAQRERIAWSSADLTRMVDLRIARVLKNAYTTKIPTSRDVFAPSRSKQAGALDYILAGSLGRPRDVIYWVNEAIKRAEGRTAVSLSNVRDAEEGFSTWRLNQIKDEWSENYPSLEVLFQLLRRRDPRFVSTDWSEDDLLNVATDWRCTSAPWAIEVADALGSPAQSGAASMRFARMRFAQILYETGAVGLLNPDRHTVAFAFQDEPRLGEESLADGAHLVIHRALWRALGVRDPK